MHLDGVTHLPLCHFTGCKAKLLDRSAPSPAGRHIGSAHLPRRGWSGFRGLWPASGAIPSLPVDRAPRAGLQGQQEGRWGIDVSRFLELQAHEIPPDPDGGLQELSVPAVAGGGGRLCPLLPPVFWAAATRPDEGGDWYRPMLRKDQSPYRC